MAFGFLVFLFLGMVPHWFRKKPQLLLFVMLFLACLITLFMDMYNTYFSDYQSQGRYLMPALVPLMVWIDDAILHSLQSFPVSGNAPPAI